MNRKQLEEDFRRTLHDAVNDQRGHGKYLILKTPYLERLVMIFREANQDDGISWHTNKTKNDEGISW